MKYDKIVFGFHGCDISVFKNIHSGYDFIPSNNVYDWLGTGIYFWEYDEDRARSWAEELAMQGKINTPAVIGAKIDLKYCLDITTQSSIKAIKQGYEFLAAQYNAAGEILPKNKNIQNNSDWKDRRLDRAVINSVHNLNSILGYAQYDSVRGAFMEGAPIYHGAGFKDKTHIQLCIRNPECILEIYKIKLIR